MVNMFEMIVVNDPSHRPDLCDLRVSHDNSTWETHASFQVRATDSIQRFMFPQSSALLWQLRIISTSGNAEPHIRDVQFLFGNMNNLHNLGAENVSNTSLLPTVV